MRAGLLRVVSPVIVHGEEPVQYRSDIEGLRGVAVALVVIAHAGMPGAWGGFIGVDIFFVISGYLITALLVDELSSRGRIDLWMFFARRVRRLLPALAAMLLATALTAIFLLVRDEWRLHARDALWGALWVGNIAQAFADLDYFAPPRESSLYLHLWSLGVEEQFYLFWPLLLWGAWRLAGLRSVLAVLVLLASIGFVAMVAHAGESAIGAYYVTTARAWQFAVGGLAWWVARDVSAGPVVSIALRALGFLLVGVATLGIDQDVRYPGFAALLPTFGAALVLVGGALPAAGSGRTWLASPLVTALGRWSYGWYLWHWPLVVLAGVLAPGSAVAVLLSVILSLMLAWASYRFLESPVRSMAVRSPRKWVVAGILGSLGLALAAFVWSALSPAATDNRSPATNQHPLRAAVQLPELYERDCIQDYQADDVSPCRFPGGMMPRGVVVMLGDSVMAQWEPALRPILRDARVELVVIAKSACAPIGEPYRLRALADTYAACLRWTDAALRRIGELKPDLVLLSMASSYALEEDAWTRGIARTAATIRQSGAAAIVMMPTPVPASDPVSCLARRGPGLPVAVTSDDCATDLEAARSTRVEAAIARGLEGMAGVSVVPTAEIACPQGVCRAWQDGRLVWRDQTHLDAGHVSAKLPEIRVALREALGHAGRGDLLPE